jgi:DNA-binding protein HU-beta
MNKTELVAQISEKSGITKAQATIAVNTLVEAIAKTLKGGGKVTLVGFGTFSVTKRAARTGRNPQTGSIIKVKAKKIARFKPASNLESIIGGGTDDTGPMRTKKIR